MSVTLEERNCVRLKFKYPLTGNFEPIGTFCGENADRIRFIMTMAKEIEMEWMDDKKLSDFMDIEEVI